MKEDIETVVNLAESGDVEAINLLNSFMELLSK